MYIHILYVYMYICIYIMHIYIYISIRVGHWDPFSCLPFWALRVEEVLVSLV